ncbi:MAG: hypothetical protein K2O81_03610, partial [Clostridia bacterium]|nr:hypothetical protein [Clostridia bacterium]
NAGCVAFNYAESGFSATAGTTIPVYVGDLNRFDFAEYTADYDYVARRENGAADNYYWACNNTQGYILSEIEADGGNIFNGVTKNTVAAMKFEKVYRIKVDDGNDTKYLMREKQPDFCYDTVGGASDYKYMTETKARTYLEGLTPRKGFTNKWVYYFNTPAQNNSYFTDLSEVLKNSNGRIPTISARWELDRPTVSVSTSAVNNTITYGENVTLSSEVNHQADGITVNYNWTFENELQIKWRTQNVNLTLPKPSENAGTYKLTVTVGCDEVTSLGAVAEASVHLNINRKQVTFDWHLPEDTVYDGTVKDVSVSLSDDRQVEGDPVGYTFVGLSRIINAGTYNFSIVTDVITNLNYEVLNPINSVTIQPCPVQVNWDNYEGLMYNGALQSPTASATGVNSDGALPVTVSGGTKNAGAHTATATTSNTNYAITNPTRTYIIAKKPLTITANNVIVAYGKTEPKKVTVSESQCQGFADGDGVSSLSGTAWESYEGKDFGVYEGGVKIRGLSSNNYDINYVYGQLTVGRRAIQLEWINTDNLVYDGSPKNVTAVVTNKGYEDDDIRVKVTGGNAYAAGTYTATAEIDPDCASANNYSFTYAPADNRQCTYNIQKRTATADWYVTQNGAKVSTYVYNGNPYSVIADAIGAVDFDKQLFRVEGEINPVNAGTYTYTLIADKSIADNYDIINGKFEFTIEKAQAEINTLLNGVSVSGEVFTAHVGDTLSWQSNFPDDVEGYYGFNNESGDAYGGSILKSADTFTLSVEGEYNFTVYILGTSNYSAKTVIFKVNVLPVGIEYPEVV